MVLISNVAYYVIQLKIAGANQAELLDVGLWSGPAEISDRSIHYNMQ